jgi:hypothetical protein
LEEDTWVFNPSDDPLMLHAEVCTTWSKKETVCVRVLESSR